MIHEELTAMEQQLQVTLPDAYKQIMLSYPWPQFASTTDSSLWDDAALNIERTLEYRAGYGGAPPWPLEYVHIGDDDDACPYALRCSDGTIVKTDHGNLRERPLKEFASPDALVQQIQRERDNDR
jgi:hypothetical protein